MAWRKDGNYARHPINAMLNYGYGVAISQLRPMWFLLVSIHPLVLHMADTRIQFHLFMI